MNRTRVGLFTTLFTRENGVMAREKALGLKDLLMGFPFTTVISNEIDHMVKAYI
jgi:hypothetical protein